MRPLCELSPPEGSRSLGLMCCCCLFSYLQVLQRHTALATSPRSLVLVAPGNPRAIAEEVHTNESGKAPADAKTVTAVAAAAAGMMKAAVPSATITAAAASAASTAAYGFRGCLYVAAYSIWTRSGGGGPAVDGDVDHVGWVRDLSTETEPWISGLYLNEVRGERVRVLMMRRPEVQSDGLVGVRLRFDELTRTPPSRLPCAHRITTTLPPHRSCWMIPGRPRVAFRRVTLPAFGDSRRDATRWAC